MTRARSFPSRPLVRVPVVDDGESLQADVSRYFATGLAPARIFGAPTLPLLGVSHTSEHTDLSCFRGKRVAVVGGGQTPANSPCSCTRAALRSNPSAAAAFDWTGAENPSLGGFHTPRRSPSASVIARTLPQLADSGACHSPSPESRRNRISALSLKPPQLPGSRPRSLRRSHETWPWHRRRRPRQLELQRHLQRLHRRRPSRAPRHRLSQRYPPPDRSRPAASHSPRKDGSPDLNRDAESSCPGSSHCLGRSTPSARSCVRSTAPGGRRRRPEITTPGSTWRHSSELGGGNRGFFSQPAHLNRGHASSMIAVDMASRGSQRIQPLELGLALRGPRRNSRWIELLHPAAPRNFRRGRASRGPISSSSSPAKLALLIGGSVERRRQIAPAWNRPPLSSTETATQIGAGRHRPRPDQHCIQAPGGDHLLRDQDSPCRPCRRLSLRRRSMTNSTFCLDHPPSTTLAAR